MRQTVWHIISSNWSWYKGGGVAKKITASPVI